MESACSLSLFCLCETFLRETISETVLSVENYLIYRNDRQSHGGGMLMYVRSSIEVTML